MSAATDLEKTLDLVLRYSRPGPRYTSYPTAPEWKTTYGAADYERRLEQAEAEGSGSALSLYFHLPFCQAMCTYCGCNVVISRRPERADAYLDYLIREMDLVCARLKTRRRVSQLHWGGGTPTFLSEPQILRLFHAIRDRFLVLPDAEVALEVDPVVTTKEQMALLRGLGFNRVSMGVQDFTPEVQQAVNRIQSVEQTRDLYEYARRLGFRGINFDLIYGLPYQQPVTFRKTLETVLAMGPDRVATFSYAHVPWMRPHQRKLDEKTLPEPREKFRLFLLARDLFRSAGYRQIGMDHFARPDDELTHALDRRGLSRNFQGYTVKPASDLIAFGVTAIGDVKRSYAQNVKTLSHYYHALDAGRLPVERGIALTPEDELRRNVITNLMCNFHVGIPAVEATYQIEFAKHFAAEIAELPEFVENGFLEIRPESIRVTDLGTLFIRNLAMVFDEYLRKPAADKKAVFSKTI